jgi:hypothetical protein
VNAVASRRRKRIAADRLIAFLTKIRSHGSLWTKCQGHVKQCIVKTQRRFRAKISCRNAHIELVKRQWQKEYGRRRSKSESIVHSSTTFIMPPHEAFKQWVRKTYTEYVIMVQGWENFEVWPLLQDTLEVELPPPPSLH